MKYTNPEIIIRNELRLCMVDGKHGYFHCWEQYMKPIEPSPLKGGAPGGQISTTFAIVEFNDRVKRVKPTEIKFIDEVNSVLGVMDNYSNYDEGTVGEKPKKD